MARRPGTARSNYGPSIETRRMRYQNSANYPLTEYFGIQFLRHTEYELLYNAQRIPTTVHGAFHSGDVMSLKIGTPSFDCRNRIVSALHVLEALGLVINLGVLYTGRTQMYKWNTERLKQIDPLLVEIGAFGFDNMDRQVIAIVKQSFDLGRAPTGADLKDFFYSTSRSLRPHLDATDIVTVDRLERKKAFMYVPTPKGELVTNAWIELSRLLKRWQATATKTTKVTPLAGRAARRQQQVSQPRQGAQSWQK